jgi:hypothetical protein
MLILAYQTYLVRAFLGPSKVPAEQNKKSHNIIHIHT